MGDEEAAIRVWPATRRAWDYYSLDHIWAMLRDEDGIDNYRQAAAWYRMANLCTDQADQLEKALAQLMARWPPNPGSAAQSFKIWVEEFILSLRDSAAAAQANEGPLITITRLLSQAKDQVGQLVQQHVESDRAERDWVAAASNAFGVVPPSPVEPGWRAALEGKARDIMFATDAAIGQTASQFRSPTPFSTSPPSRQSQIVEPPDPDRTGNGRPVVPVPVVDLQSRSLTVPVGEDARDPGGSDRPILDGTQLSFSGDSVDGAKGVWTGTFVNTPAGRVLAPGGVIGPPGEVGVVDDIGRNSSHVDGAGGTGNAVRGAANGAAGMIAPPIGRAGPAASGPNSAVRSSGRRRRRSDPDDPWVPAGGPSVLEPTPEPDWFDPGPNVIGIDR